MDNETDAIKHIRYEQQLITQRELFKEKLTEGRSTTTIIVTSFSVFLAVSSALLKFSLDSKLDKSKAIVMIIAGLFTSAIFLTACVFMWFIRKSLLRDIKIINRMTDAQYPPTELQLTPLKFVSITVALWTFLALTGWSVMLILSIRGN